MIENSHLFMAVLVFFSNDNFYRDEEKKMGTLVKEDFGRPDRANTMVRIWLCFICIGLLFGCLSLTTCFAGYEAWFL